MRPRRQQFAVALLAFVVVSTVTPFVVVAATYDTPEPVTPTVPLQTNSGPTVLVKDPDLNKMNVTEPFVNDTAVDLATDAGNMTINGSGGSVTVQDIRGTTTNTTGLSVAGESVTLSPPDKPTVTLSGDVDTFNWTDYKRDDGTADFHYSGASGTTTVTLSELPADTGLVAEDATGSRLDTALVQNDGTATLSLPNSGHTVFLKSAQVDGPQLTDPEPTGGQATAPTQISVNVSHPEFSEGETVDVELKLDGTTVATKTVSSPGRVSATVSPGPGEHTASAVATDDDGLQDTINWSFTSPGFLKIRPLDSPTTLASATTHDVTIYSVDGDVIDERTVSDGTVDLSGIGPQTDILVDIAPQSTYHDRSYVATTNANQSVFLLDSTTSPTEIDATYTLDDRSGQFPPTEAKLLIQRKLDVGSGPEWITVAGDEFGSSEQFTEKAQPGVRYRLLVRNEEGTTRELDTFTSPSGDFSRVIRVGQFRIEAPPQGQVYSIRSQSFQQDTDNDAAQEQFVRFGFRYGGNVTRLDWGVYRRSDNALVSSGSLDLSDNADGKFVKTIEVNRSVREESFEVRIELNKRDPQTGEIDSVQDRAFAGDVPRIFKNIVLDPRWSELLGYVGIAAATGLVVIVDASLAALAAAIMGWLVTLLGIVDIPEVALGLGTAVGVLAIFGRERS